MTIFSNYSFQKNILLYSKQLILNDITDSEIKSYFLNVNFFKYFELLNKNNKR